MKKGGHGEMRTAVPVFLFIFGMQAIAHAQTPTASRQPLSAEQGMQVAARCLVENADFRLLGKLLERAEKSGERYGCLLKKSLEPATDHKAIWESSDPKEVWEAHMAFAADRAAAEIQMDKISISKLECAGAFGPKMVVSIRSDGQRVMLSDFKTISLSLDALTKPYENRMDKLRALLMIYVHFEGMFREKDPGKSNPNDQEPQPQSQPQTQLASKFK